MWVLEETEAKSSSTASMQPPHPMANQPTQCQLELVFTTWLWNNHLKVVTLFVHNKKILQERLLKQFMNTELPGRPVKFLLSSGDNEVKCCKFKLLIHHHISYLAAEAQNPEHFLMLGKSVINAMR